MRGVTPPPGGGESEGRGQPHPGNLVGHQESERVEQGDIKEQEPIKQSYSERLKTNVRFDQRLKRNILEITLEKTDSEANLADVKDEDIARVLRSLGIDIAGQTQGYQVHYKGRISIISVWMCAGINLEKFCKDVNVKVSKGIMTGMIRPAGKTDVTVKIEGLDFNTPDNLIREYLSKFGTVRGDSVIYGKYDGGPFKGKYNGDRRFQVDFTASVRQMGTFHIIDGSKVKIFYRGNMKTCGRCHKTAADCQGEAVARNCALAGGERVLLTQHMKNLWKDIGFAPVSFEMEEDEKTGDDMEQDAKDASMNSQTVFPRNAKPQQPSERDIEKFDGVTIRNIPKEIAKEDIIAFLYSHGLPPNHKEENLKINKGERNTCVFIDNLSPNQVVTLQKSIHFHDTNLKFFEVPLYCKPTRVLTPIKKTTAVNDEHDDAENKAKTNSHDLDDKHVITSIASSKPLIPGLPETERLKAMKPRTRKNKKKSEKLQLDDLPSTPYSGTSKPPDFADEFIFSEPEDEETDSCEDAFEDSREEPQDIHPLDPSVSALKRAARSPPEQKDIKKQRGLQASL